MVLTAVLLVLAVASAAADKDTYFGTVTFSPNTQGWQCQQDTMWVPGQPHTPANIGPNVDTWATVSQEALKQGGSCGQCIQWTPKDDKSKPFTAILVDSNSNSKGSDLGCGYNFDGPAQGSYIFIDCKAAVKLLNQPAPKQPVQDPTPVRTQPAVTNNNGNNNDNAGSSGGLPAWKPEVHEKATWYWESKGPETQACAGNGMAPKTGMPTVALGMWNMKEEPKLTDICGKCIWVRFNGEYIGSIPQKIGEDRFVEISNTCKDEKNCPYGHLDFFVGTTMGNHDGIQGIDWQYINCDVAKAEWSKKPTYNRRRELKEHASMQSSLEGQTHRRRAHTTGISNRKVMLADYLA
jgi:hypothetical protein